MSSAFMAGVIQLACWIFAIQRDGEQHAHLLTGSIKECAGYPEALAPDRLAVWRGFFPS
jgi:hypothetical protein